jgi:hypothetical protein
MKGGEKKKKDIRLSFFVCTVVFSVGNKGKYRKIPQEKKILFM